MAKEVRIALGAIGIVVGIMLGIFVFLVPPSQLTGWLFTFVEPYSGMTFDEGVVMSGQYMNLVGFLNMTGPFESAYIYVVGSATNVNITLNGLNVNNGKGVLNGSVTTLTSFDEISNNLMPAVVRFYLPANSSLYVGQFRVLTPTGGVIVTNSHGQSVEGTTLVNFLPLVNRTCEGIMCTTELLISPKPPFTPPVYLSVTDIELGYMPQSRNLSKLLKTWCPSTPCAAQIKVNTTSGQYIVINMTSDIKMVPSAFQPHCLYGEAPMMCGATKPKVCDYDGNYFDNCSKCNCASGYTCDGSSCIQVIPPCPSTGCYANLSTTSLAVPSQTLIDANLTPAIRSVGTNATFTNSSMILTFYAPNNSVLHNGSPVFANRNCGSDNNCTALIQTPMSFVLNLPGNYSIRLSNLTLVDTSVRVNYSIEVINVSFRDLYTTPNVTEMRLNTVIEVAQDRWPARLVAMYTNESVDGVGNVTIAITVINSTDPMLFPRILASSETPPAMSGMGNMVSARTWDLLRGASTNGSEMLVWQSNNSVVAILIQGNVSRRETGSCSNPPCADLIPLVSHYSQRYPPTMQAPIHTFSYNLTSFPQIISIPIQPLVNSLYVMFSNLSCRLQVLDYSGSQQWAVFNSDPSAPSTLISIEPLKAYIATSDQNCTGFIVGSAISGNVSRNLTTGWNLLGVHTTNCTSYGGGFNVNAIGQSCNLDNLGIINKTNSISAMQSGRDTALALNTPLQLGVGYWINITQNATITIS